jgi:2-oxo-3-hexenedioate decarboxylase
MPMTQGARAADLDAIAAEALAALRGARSIAPMAARFNLSLEDAYRVLAKLQRQRDASGEPAVGRKIGFTNPKIWPEYGVNAPGWGYVTTASCRDLAATKELPLAGFVEPKIEPEIMFGLAHPPAPGMDEAALAGCIDWVAHGYEIVQSIYPGWKFVPADTVVANAMHGALLVGKRHAFAPRQAEWLRELASFEIDLYRNGSLADRGGGAAVLGSPVAALGHLVALLAQDPVNPPLKAGEIVSTGTLTRALPIVPGETWHTELRGIPLEGVSLVFC